jgi:hypothetical protein
MGLTFWGGGRIYVFFSAMHLPLSPELDLLDANLIKRKEKGRICLAQPSQWYYLQLTSNSQL